MQTEKSLEELREERADANLVYRRSRVRQMADTLAIVAGILFAISVILFLVALKNSIAEMQSDFGRWILGGSFLFASAFIFLLAQIIYIRVNTEK